MNSRLVTHIVSIVAYSAVPFAGVLFFGWDWREIMIFYWLGNISMGLSVVIDMIKMSASQVTLGDTPTVHSELVSVPSFISKLFIILFFCVHYGIFTLVHGIFVFAIVKGAFVGDVSDMPVLDYGSIAIAWLTGTIAYVMVKCISPTEDASVSRLWGLAYGRIVTLHISIIIGAFIMQLLHLPAIVAVLIIGFNLIIQLKQAKYSFTAHSLPVVVKS